MLRIDLLNKVKEITSSGLPFMEGKEKSEMVENKLYVIKHFGYLEGADEKTGELKEFVVLADESNFYFGGSVVTDSFKKLEKALDEKEINEILESGLEMKISKKTSKANRRKYTSCEFFPDEKKAVQER